MLVLAVAQERPHPVEVRLNAAAVGWAVVERGCGEIYLLLLPKRWYHY